MNQKNIQLLHKFGGSSLANAERFENIKSLLNNDEVVVVSAVKGITSELQSVLDLAKQNQFFIENLKEVEQTHKDISSKLLTENEQKEIMLSISNDIQKIKDILQAVQLTSSYSKEIQEIILGFGEQWSAKILTSYLAQESKTVYLDASLVLYIYEKNGVICIDWNKSKNALDNFLTGKTWNKLVITGFIASTLDGKKTILGRNGSDFSAAIFAKLFDVKKLFIWTDVDGIFSADPQFIRSAFPIESMSYQEALELAYFGAKIIHPMTIAPAIDKQIPIYIKNSYNPSAQGTCISAAPSQSSYPITAISCIENISLINIEGTGMIGVSGIAARVFQILHNAHISVILISQASSEHSICFAISATSSNLAVEALNEGLQFEIEHHQIEGVFADTSCSILAVVGDAMVGTVGVAGKLCGTLAKASINIRAISQGSSERNISLVIANRDIKRAMKVVHSGFYLAPRTISIGIIGPGLVGSTLLKQISEIKEQIKLKYKANLQIRGLMNSKKMLLTYDPLNLNTWETEIKNSKLNSNMESFSAHILSDDVSHAVIIDCTADQSVADQYAYLLQKGIHIITPNKRANSGDFKYYKNIKSIARDKNLHYLYEATVCAGLPVISTIQDLIKTGDEVVSIQGIFSGTLSFIFNEVANGKTFSEAVMEAKKLGYTEPDPRDDLTGTDVARKLICLAREVGYDFSLGDVEVQNLVPKELKDLSTEDFQLKLPLFDKEFSERVNQARLNNEKLCYVASLQKNGKLLVSTQSFPHDHPLSRLQGADNMLIVYTNRYSKQPLVIQGPGAGAEVTAAGIFADLLRFVTFLS